MKIQIIALFLLMSLSSFSQLGNISTFPYYNGSPANINIPVQIGISGPIRHIDTGFISNLIRSLAVSKTVASVPVNYGYSTSDPYINPDSAPTYTSLGSINVAPSDDISIVFDPVAADNYIVIKVPFTEPLKTNGSYLPDQTWRVLPNVFGFTYYISRNPYAINGPVKLFR